MYSRAQSKSSRPFRSLSVDWRHIAWRPRIVTGTPVSDPARWSTVCSSVIAPAQSVLGQRPGFPWRGLSGGMLPAARPRIQFPTL
jgi:hypothetical protein